MIIKTEDKKKPQKNSGLFFINKIIKNYTVTLIAYTIG